MCCILFIDPVIIGLIIAAFNYGNDFEFTSLIFPSVIIFVSSIILSFAMAATAVATESVLLAVVIFLPLYAIVAGLVIGFVAGMSLQRAMIAGGIFAAYKLVTGFMMIAAGA